MHVTKRQLGEGYLAGTSVVLISILLWAILSATGILNLWITILVVPALALGGQVLWFHRLDLDGRQVWSVAMYAAMGLGVVTVLLVISHLAMETLTVSVELTIALGMLLATGVVGGVLVGISMELHSQTHQLRLRNAVLYRVLRHNLRNDMTVVLAQLDEVKHEVEDEKQQQLEKAEQKIYALVELTDKVRQLNLMLDKNPERSTIDLAATIEHRIGVLEETYPNVDIEGTLPETAPVVADEQFGIVLDNIVESALQTDRTSVELTVDCIVDDKEVTLLVEDHTQKVPEQDLSVIDSESVQQLEHGDSMELWLVYWLTDHNGGELDIETEGSTKRMTITLERARPNESRFRPSRGL